MAGEWIETTIGEIADVVGGSTPSTKDPANFDGHIPWLTPKDLSGPHRRYVERGERNLSEQGLRGCSAQLLPKNSVLLSSRAPIGYVAIAANPIATNQGFRSLVVKPEYHHEFLFYWLTANVDELERHASGSTFKELSGTSLKKIRIRLPAGREEQRAIAHILGTLDDKIELNRRMSETLEAMARALFKSWFVDFDPVRAKAEGRDPGLPKPLADLFPARLVASELGEIPEGWEIGVLENALAEIEVGGRPKGGVAAYSQGVPSIGAESIVGLGIFDYSKTKFVPREYFEQMTKGHIKSRDVLLYKDGGRPGEFEPHVTLIGDGFPFETAAINEHVYRLRARPHVGQEFLFFWLSSDLVMEEMRIKGTGVAVPGLNSTQVKSLTTLLPSTAVVEAFAQYAEPCVARVLAACKESRTLTSLRDALLPKLISGELRLPAALRERAAQAGVKDAERIVGRCL